MWVLDAAFDLLKLTIHGQSGAGEGLDLLGHLLHLRTLVFDLLPCVDLAAAEITQGEAEGPDLSVESFDLLISLQVGLLGAVSLPLQVVQRLLAHICLLLGGLELLVQCKAVDDGTIVMSSLCEIGTRIDDLEVCGDAGEVAVARHFHALVVALHKYGAAEDVPEQGLKPRIGIRCKLDQIQQRLDACRDLLLRALRHLHRLKRVDRDDAAPQLLIDLEHGLRRFQRVYNDRSQLSLRSDVNAWREPLRTTVHEVDQASHIAADVVGFAPLLNTLQSAEDRLAFLELSNKCRHLLLLDFELLDEFTTCEDVLFELDGRLPLPSSCLIDLLHGCAQFCLQLGNLLLRTGCGLFAILDLITKSPLLALGVTPVLL